MDWDSESPSNAFVVSRVMTEPTARSTSIFRINVYLVGTAPSNILSGNAEYKSTFAAWTVDNMVRLRLRLRTKMCVSTGRAAVSIADVFYIYFCCSFKKEKEEKENEKKGRRRE
jgi:hypothetical protein